MTPDHIIDKALDAWIGDHNCPHPDLIHVYRVLITRSLEAVAADIWDQGWVSRHADGEQYTVTPNPYREKEG